MIGYIKLGLMIVMMTLGFFLTYGLVWIQTGHDITNVSCMVLAALAILSEVAYILWVGE